MIEKEKFRKKKIIPSLNFVTNCCYQFLLSAFVVNYIFFEFILHTFNVMQVIKQENKREQSGSMPGLEHLKHFRLCVNFIIPLKLKTFRSEYFLRFIYFYFTTFLLNHFFIILFYFYFILISVIIQIEFKFFYQIKYFYTKILDD